MADRQGFKETIERLREAVAATYRGDPGPYIELWSRRDPLSLFGALGPCKTTRPDIERTFRWVASRFGNPYMSTDLEVVEVGQDMAYTVGYEQGHLAIDGKPQPVKIRVTQIFRRESDKWRMVHRHGDFAPTDDRPHPGPPPRPRSQTEQEAMSRITRSRRQGSAEANPKHHPKPTTNIR